ncbi:GMC family oxidoreductase [Mucilaginibacter myungsuensis]|uniref:Choline dehydrogenase-like flavoprotein n=1 Tax=Mucilaginibacter myungsuensis TaxID=649104 RepID=A0A929KRY7_9SPHI|nr:hypothetical protein [Mucilaginibacter myungsuensis]MBE9660401.1 hypothetical protein [Mucilaginibacter myungsuensis]MDN3600444.1 hypothetical protein [Mucilaginibacter myungsuensis]
MPLNIVIIGAGTYGCYLANAISEKYPDAQIKLFDVGDSNIKSESEIGFLSKVMKGAYKASSDGRFFGLGGTSAKWGGQLLFFSERDFASDRYMDDIVDYNIKHHRKVLSRFFKDAPDLKETSFDNDLFIKKGIWLKFNQRNLFKHFDLARKSNITVYNNSRVIDLLNDGEKITGVKVQNSNNVAVHTADIFYLTSGAFESLRLLEVSGLADMQESSAGFADHVSLRCFKVHSPTAKVGKQDFQFRFLNGSMITSRLVGEIDNVSYYIHAIFNEDFNIFQFLKQLIFKGKFSTDKLTASLKQFIYIFPFVFSYLFLKKLYIFGSWYINVDIELPANNNSIKLSDQIDAYGQRGINIDYNITPDATARLLAIKQRVKTLLDASGLKYTELADTNASALKLEDTYHPYKLFKYNGSAGIDSVYQPLKGLFLFNTGLLYRSGGINPTASIFCLIEQHIAEVMHNLPRNQ